MLHNTGQVLNGMLFKQKKIMLSKSDRVFKPEYCHSNAKNICHSNQIGSMAAYC
jgi:hypothetical protein